MATKQIPLYPESATAALSYARAHSKELGIEEKWFEEHQVHVHMPAGAIPKDGPSAGITIATAIISLMTDTEVRKDIAMTGEVDISGNVLPIGGLKEKIIAAHRAGITTVLVPQENYDRDLEDIPESIRGEDGITILPVSKIEEVFGYAFTQPLAEADFSKAFKSLEEVKQEAMQHMLPGRPGGAEVSIPQPGLN